MGAGRELSAQHQDGRLIPVEVGLSPISVGGKRFVLSTVVDVTERRRLESELAHAQKRQTLGNLASGVAHDLSNFLFAISGHAELALQDEALHPETRKSLDAILETTLQARIFVQKVLSVARNDELRREAVDWEPVVQNVRKILSLSLPANTTIEVSIAPDVAPVRADPIELQQILMNLLTNAIHATKSTGGAIRVKVAEIPVEVDAESGSQGTGGTSQICLSVTDDGEGMAPSVLRRVFDPFFTTKPPGEGTGLGMGVIRRVVHDLWRDAALSRPGEVLRRPV